MERLKEQKITKIEKASSDILEKGKRIITAVIAFTILISGTGCSNENEKKYIPGYNITYQKKSDNVYLTEDNKLFYTTENTPYAILAEPDDLNFSIPNYINYEKIVNSLDEFDKTKEILESYNINTVLKEYEIARKENNITKLNSIYSKLALLTLKSQILGNTTENRNAEITLRPIDDSEGFKAIIKYTTNEKVPGNISVQKNIEKELYICNVDKIFESIVNAQNYRYTTVEEFDDLYSSLLYSLLNEAYIQDDTMYFKNSDFKTLELKRELKIN